MARTVCIYTTYILSVTIGTAMLLLGVIVYTQYFPEIINMKLQENLALRNGTLQGDRFQQPPVPLYIKVYFFNVTNKDEVNEKGEDAVVEELGPYVFRQDKIKEVSLWDEVSGTVRYKERRTFHFEPNMSTGSLSDSINHVNVVSISLGYVLLKKNLQGVLPFIGGTFVETHTVRELMFDGYSIQEYFPWLIRFTCNLKNNCMFAFYYGKNGTTGKEFEISSGVLSMADYTVIKRYNNDTKLPFWYGKSCNEINGTDGQQFPPGVTKEDKLYVFSHDVCRSLRLQYEQESAVEGIQTLRFMVPPELFANPNVNKDNMCFCHEDQNKPCPSSRKGVMPLHACQDGSPVMVSAPHFYHADPESWEKFKGLQPDKTKHESFLDIEPLSGAVISAAKRLQISVLIPPMKSMKMLKFIKELTFFPVLWVEESGGINAEIAGEIRRRLIIPYKVVKWSLIVSSVVGGVILLTVLGVLCHKSWKKRRSQRTLSSPIELKDGVGEKLMPVT